VLVVVGVASLVLAATKFVDFSSTAAVNPVSAFLQKHINLIILIQLPLLSLFGRMLFRSEKLHFAEHLVLASYASGFRSIFFTMAIAPLWMITKWNHGATVGVYLLIWLVYYGIASAQFYTGNRWWLWCKGFATALLAQLAVSGLIWFGIRIGFMLSNA
jgi:hypothetical protein